MFHLPDLLAKSMALDIFMLSVSSREQGTLIGQIDTKAYIIV